VHYPKLFPYIKPVAKTLIATAHLKYGWYRSPDIELRWQTRRLDHLRLHHWSLSLTRSHLHALISTLSLSHIYICFLFLSIIISRGCVGVDACDWRMVVKLDCISDSGVPCGKHKCRSDFKRGERLQQSISGHWSHCCRLFHKFFLCCLHFSLYLVAGNILTLLHNVCL